MLHLCLIELPNLALENPEMYHPLGLLYIAAMVEEAGYDLEIADLRSGEKPLPEAEFYGFSCTTPEINYAKEIARKVNGKTIVGGPHPSLLPNDCLNDFDYIVRGEGEVVILQILAGSLEASVINAPRIIELDAIPLPARHRVKDPFSDTLFTGERYGVGEKTASLIVSRGCPYSCSFCGNIYQNPVAYRSVENILFEIWKLKKQGVRHLRFVDDNFTLHPDFEKLCFALKDREMHYRCHTRSNLIDKEKAQWLKYSGCEECSLGVESADVIVLDINNKKETPERHGDAIKILKDAGLRSKVYLMSGLPGETDKTMELNKEFMIKYKPDKWTLSTFTPYPGCDIFNNPDKYDVEIVNKDWSNWWNFVMPVEGKELPGRAGYVHILKGQTKEQMGERHDKFYEWLKKEDWK